MDVENYELRRTWTWATSTSPIERKIKPEDSRGGTLHPSREDLASRNVSHPSQLSRALVGHAYGGHSSRKDRYEIY